MGQERVLDGTTFFRCPTRERHACYFMFSEPAAVCQNTKAVCNCIHATYSRFPATSMRYS
jgi:hypothetical protein